MQGLHKTIAVNILALAIFWLVAFTLVRFGGSAGTWVAASVGAVIASAIGLAIAWRLGARYAAILIAAQVAFTLAELSIHSIYGIATAQGAPAHFAVMAAGLIGVI